MSEIGGIEIYPIISFLIFFIFFLVVLILVFGANKEYLREMEHLPLDGQADEEGQDNVLFHSNQKVQ
ncbi:CcoQ/FixQ family Cbb3-type cytochrome c oxidase assembly chaperone [Cytophagaceae bacterium ABcell3]|nr:CcoQ/FixQ family Cbb3-type cytochrome c oxidase assembly chaperone [Cytophagaceae bacterium ABcell3]